MRDLQGQNHAELGHHKVHAIRLYLGGDHENEEYISPQKPQVKRRDMLC